METVSQELYNPHAFIAVRRIDSTTQENTFPIYKATDVEQVLNRINLLEQRIEHQEKQIGQILGNMTAQGWYNPNTDKEEILSDLCDILGFEPKQDITIKATVIVDVTYACPLDELEDFDARYFLQDTLTVDAYNGDVIIDSFDVEDADVEF